MLRGCSIQGGAACVAGARAVPQLDVDLVHREIGRLELDARAKVPLVAIGDAQREAAAALLQAALLQAALLQAALLQAALVARVGGACGREHDVAHAHDEGHAARQAQLRRCL